MGAISHIHGGVTGHQRGSMEASYVAAYWRVRVSGSSSLVDRRLYV